MERTKIISLIKTAINCASGGFSKEEFDSMKNFLSELENESSAKRSSDDWRGCQGTCDFEEIPNVTGWI